MRKVTFILGLLLGLFSISVNATVVYVDSSHIAGTQDGLSWATAFSSFQAGINAANAGDSVWVAKGTYLPAANSSFSMKDSVMIFGGFLNTMSLFSQRNFQTNTTKLKGNTGSVILNTSNHLTKMSVLDGFTVTHDIGASNTGIMNGHGSPTIRNCIFSNNKIPFSLSGGGIFNSASSPEIDNCLFINNSSVGGGGGVFNIDGSNSKITNCTFINNRGARGGAIANELNSKPQISNSTFIGNVSVYEGGAIENENSDAFIINCLFLADSSMSSGGGAIFNYNCSPKIVNSTLVNNYAANGGGGIGNNVSSPVVSNSIIWNNSSGIIEGTLSSTTVRYSLIQGLAGNLTFHNLDGTIDPLFADPSTGNYKLKFDSPCINTGNNDSLPNTFILDLSGNSRIWSNTIDIGAYEYTLAVNLGHDTVICTTGSVIIDAQNQGSTFLWSTGETTQNISVNSSGTYSVSVSNIWGSVADTIQVALVVPPIVNLGNDITTGMGTITLDAGNPGATYLWNTGATTQTTTVNTSGTYSVVVTNTGGCSASDTIVVSMSPDGIENAPGISQIIKVYPNPVKDIVHIDIDDLKLLHSKITLIDAFGRTIRTKVIENKLQDLSVAGVAPGIYVLKFENGATAKIIKQ